MDKLITLTENDLHNIIFEVLSYIGNCTEDDDASYFQSITHFDEMSNNEYNIQDEYYDDGIIEIIPTEEFLSNISGYSPDINDIVYCAYNHDMNIGFIYTIDDIHYFYN